MTVESQSDQRSEHWEWKLVGSYLLIRSESISTAVV